jgi:hypothetical protein
VVRELRYRVRVPGVRTKEVTLVTTLLDAERYPANELARLYGLRDEKGTPFFFYLLSRKGTVSPCAPCKVSIFSGCNSHPATVAPAGSNRSGSGGNDTAEASDAKGCSGNPAQAGRN